MNKSVVINKKDGSDILDVHINYGNMTMTIDVTRDKLSEAYRHVQFWLDDDMSAVMEFAT